MSKLKVGVVVPSNRPERKAPWLEAWKRDLEDDSYEAKLYWIEDQPDTWGAIKEDLKKDAWIIPVKTDCIRSYGFLQSFRDGNNVTITLDDDVVPIVENPIRGHLDWLNTSIEPDNWVRTVKSIPTRGLPMVRHIVINHGLWSGVPDVSGEQQLAMEKKTIPEGIKIHYTPTEVDELIVPINKYYPMSGMNLAFDTRITRFMYFTLQGCDIRDPGIGWGVHRCGDILAGVLSKTVLDNFEFAGVHSGTPYVYHDRLSNAQNNMEMEKNSRDLSGIVASRISGQRSYLGCAEALRHLHVAGVRKDYFKQLSNAMRTWYELCKGEPGEYTRTSGPTSSGPVPQPEDAATSGEGLAKD